MFDTRRSRTVLVMVLAVLIGVAVGFFVVTAFGDTAPPPPPPTDPRPSRPTDRTPPPSLDPLSPSVGSYQVTDVVGQRLPAAEQKLTTAGFLSRQERDATEQGRTVLEKDNWMVLAQDPPAGSISAPTTVVVLALRKPTDDHVPVVIGAGVMPDVICAELQTAQDVIRASKLYAIISRDATNQGRIVLLDRNWVVVAQSIRPG